MLVHGSTTVGEMLSDGLWPATKWPSSKGPYGQTGLYTEDEGPFACVEEADFLRGWERGWVHI